jgi:MarR family transcriptional regulator, lower aerobic nicotinate degradation pathway regulator
MPSNLRLRNASRKHEPQGSIARDLAVLYDRPGFLLRRAHQIGVSIFLEETAAEGITTTSQFGLMLILRARPGLDQIGLAELIGLDRSTTGLVISKLEADGLLIRRPSVRDRRRKELELTKRGSAFLARLEVAARRVEDRALEPFTRDEAAEFFRLLKKFVDSHNAHVRIPMSSDSASK